MNVRYSKKLHAGCHANGKPFTGETIPPSPSRKDPAGETHQKKGVMRTGRSEVAGVTGWNIRQAV